MLELLSVGTTFFTIFGYQMSYLEFFGTLATLLGVWLVSKNTIITWPVQIIGVILYLVMFYQLRLYSDFFEQWYYLLTSFWGWITWKKLQDKATAENGITISSLKLKGYLISIFALLATTLFLWIVMLHINQWLPSFFPKPAQLPFLDAFTTAMSFVATVLLIYKKRESWWLWIVVDIIGIGLYNYVGVPFVALLYFIFLIIATQGAVSWHKIYWQFQSKQNV